MTESSADHDGSGHSATSPPGDVDSGDDSLRRGMNARTLTGQATMLQRAASMAPDCGGSVSFEPSHQLVVAEPMRIALDVTRASHDDLVLVARDSAGGWHCDDDGGAGLLPRIDTPVPAGPMQVWVGTYQHAMSTSWTLQVTEGAPPLRLDSCDASATIVIDDAFERATTSGSTTAARTCEAAIGAAGCVGAFDTTGGPCIEVRTETRVTLRAVSDRFDPVLALQASDPLQTRINDDEGSSSLHARITATLAPGRYAAQVGAWDLREGGAWRLLIERAADPTSMVIPTGCLRLSAGRPIRVSGATGANRSCEDRIGVPCPGWMPAAENLCLLVTERLHLAATVVDAEFDATAAITGPGVARFADDGGVFPLPSVTATLNPGRYDVRVGSRERSIGGVWQMELDPVSASP